MNMYICTLKKLEAYKLPNRESSTLHPFVSADYLCGVSSTSNVYNTCTDSY